MMLAQLDLWEAQLALLPWRGISPRELTRSRKALFLRREPQKPERFFVDPEQLDLLPAAIKRPSPVWGGVPSLLPLPRRI